MHKKIRIIIALAVIVAGISYSVFVWQQTHYTGLVIAMLNIGQGDSFYIRTPAGKDIVIDGGPDRSVLSELGRVMPSQDHVIELVVATHPDADHITGLTQLRDTYTVETLMTNGETKQTGVATALERWQEDGSAHVLHPQRGDRLDIEPDLWLEFLSPSTQRHEDANDDSIVFILHYKNATALFTGDASSTVEQEILDTFDRAQLDVDLLKASHHGSHTGSSMDFLRVVKPEIALISAGVNNKYGHPHASVLYHLEQVSEAVFRTDRVGRLRCTSHGENFLCQHDY